MNAPKESSDVTTDEPKDKIHDKSQSVDRIEGEREDELYDIPLRKRLKWTGDSIMRLYNQQVLL